MQQKTDDIIQSTVSSTSIEVNKVRMKDLIKNILDDMLKNSISCSVCGHIFEEKESRLVFGSKCFCNNCIKSLPKPDKDDKNML